ncbi:protein FAR1-RELATED SEQUENCE 5-like [Primulina eburnea]|uniref:protein FAR1-RELATED SEQUENCE 5-like n=1 Tax=Primulina eburnea TaxID=1245227 RepID=UPI003C6C2B98
MEENGGDELSYIPQVGDNQKPEIGMKFESLEEAFSFCNQYARESGFSARMSNSKKSNKTNEVIWKKFVCFKEGHTDAIRWSKQSKSDEPVKERARGEIRTGCKLKISVVKEQTGVGWVVSTFVESHNHPLSTPSKVYLLRSHRTVSAAKKALTQQFAEANVPTCQQMRLFEIESGGPEHVGCTERDIRNYEKTLRDEHKGIDAETLIDFFLSEKDKSSTFFFNYETDSENRFIRCFWADPVSRRAYTAFGDVVVFDTTYNTNKYEMIFAPFVGVNHHHQTIVFGCGFLSDEKTDSFVWLLNKFLEAMHKGAPNLIITDQDPAMTKAIGEVFPKTIHRYCLWHILNKFPDNLGNIWAWGIIKSVNPDRDGLTLVVSPIDPYAIIPVSPYDARWKIVNIVGFQPYMYNAFAGQFNVKQNFSTPSPFSHQSSFGRGSDMVSDSGIADFCSFGQQDFQTPSWSNIQSFTNLLNVGPHHLVHGIRT